jgi:hypothetical protein
MHDGVEHRTEACGQPRPRRTSPAESSEPRGRVATVSRGARRVAGYVALATSLVLGCTGPSELPPASGQVPAALEGAASACMVDGDCGPGGRCCGGACVVGDCCTSEECGGRVCRGNRCQACEGDAACGAGSVCCGGLCRAGACCTDAECPGGQLCRQGACVACAGDGDCAAGARCSGGRCAAGSTCSPGSEFIDGLCVPTAAVGGGGVAPGASCQQSSDCGFAQTCCGNRCVLGECCANADCATSGNPGASCIQNVCQPCFADAQCGAGSVCCSGQCFAGACCPGAPCADGRVCSNYQCAACQRASDCGAGSTCCNGTCQAGSCCSNADCGVYTCRGGACAVCQADGDCGAGKRCCGGACTTAACCADGDCASGLRCVNGACTACRKNADCGRGSVCCGGRCESGNCCSTGDCGAGQVCNSNYQCSLCTSNAECAAGQVCCGGSCVNGNCCGDAECGAGRVCRSNSCNACQKDDECGRGELCCNGGCQRGNCCTDGGVAAAVPACAGLVCVGNACTSCSSDGQCGAGAKCCRGACFKGITCCGNEECPSGQRCQDGTCKGCTTDADCGALKCCTDCGGTGRCLAFCGIDRLWSSKDSFDEGARAGTTADGNPQNAACMSGTLCRAPPGASVTTPWLFVASSAQGALFRYSLQTGAPTGPFATGVRAGWPAQSGTAPGVNPGPTAVNVYEGVVWVANRGQPAGNASSGLAKLDFDGQLQCFANVAGGASALTLDARGDAWVGSLDGQRLIKFSGADVIAGSTPAACRPVLQLDVPLRPVALTTDERGQLWALGADGRLISVDPSGALITRVFDANCAAAGLAVDRTFAYVTCPQAGQVTRVNRVTGFRDFIATGGAPVGVTVGSGGQVTIAGGDGRLFTLNGLTPTPVSLTGTTRNLGVATDSAGRTWAVDETGPLVRLDAQGQQRFAGQGAQLVSGDLTGQQYVNTGVAPARWSAVYDSGAPTPRWLSLRLNGTTPPGTTVTVRVRTASTASGLATAAWSAPQLALPVDLSRLGLPQQRYIEVELVLRAVGAGLTPSVGLVSVRWAARETPVCLCPPGYVRDGINCVDIDECGFNNGGCSENALCTNTPGGRRCTCKAGYTGDGELCTDVNECLTNNGGCPGDETCTNLPGGARCCPRCNAWDTSAQRCVPSIEFFSTQVAPAASTVYVSPPGVSGLYFGPTSVSAQATVNTRSRVTYRLQNNPPWLSVNPTTGAVSGTPTNNATDPGTRTVTLVASTDCGSSATTTFSLTVLANAWCGDGVVQQGQGESCDTESRSCTSNSVVGLPSYCTGTFAGIEQCSSTCNGYGPCTATQPTVIGNSFQACDEAEIRNNNFYCCAMDSCRNDACCGGRNGTNSSLSGGYSQQSFLSNSQGNGNCRLGRSGSNWAIAVSHTTAAYRCWR